MCDQTLVEQALHVPRREAARWRHVHLDQEELVADGNVGLVKAARRYDASRGVPFQAFATPFVRGAIADTVRSRARKHNLGDGTFALVVGFPDVAPLDGFAGDGDLTFEPPHPGPTPQETVESLDRLRTLATLPEPERIALVRTIVDGEAAANVAHELGVTPNRVYSLVHTGSARLRRRAA